jgi:hypothetical protein
VKRLGFSGVAALAYYGTSINVQLGMDVDTAGLANAVVTLFALLATCVATVVHQLGRRAMLLGSLAGLTVIDMLIMGLVLLNRGGVKRWHGTGTV